MYHPKMVRAVNDIHNKNIVHCDLKPSNFVLIKGMLKLIDFGISKVLPAEATNVQKNSRVGTINYMSPESLTDVVPQNSHGILVKQGILYHAANTRHQVRQGCGWHPNPRRCHPYDEDLPAKAGILTTDNR